MSLATPADARIDSSAGGFLLVAVLSFAFGIFLSLLIVDHPQVASERPCPVSCPRLIQMNHRAKAAEDAADGRCDMRWQSPFALDAMGGDAIL